MSDQSTKTQNTRHFMIDPTGNCMIAQNQDSGGVVVLGLDSETNNLGNGGKTIKPGEPVCVVFTGK